MRDVFNEKKKRGNTVVDKFLVNPLNIKSKLKP